jgi:RNA polymerase sigma factor (sigma-70 family)
MSTKTSMFADDLLYHKYAENSLPRDEEYQLMLRIKKGDQSARDKLVRHYFRFVFMFAKKYVKRGLPLEDLVQEGMMGLLKAVDMFEPERGFRLTTYANWWINAYLQRHCELHRTCVRPVTMNRQTVSIPMDVSLNVPFGEGTEEFINLLESEAPGVDVVYEDDKFSELIREKVNLLKERCTPVELDIVESRLLKEDPDTLKVIGERHGMCRERVRQIEVEVKKFFKKNLAEEHKVLAA